MWQRLHTIEDSNERQSPRARFRRPWIWRLTVVALVVIIAIAVPVAIVMSRQYKSKTSPSRAEVIVPLYVYPAPGAWEPLYQAANASTSLNFTVVVNPNNGPGNNTLPDENYINGITRLNSFSNVKLLGYVPLGYGNNSINEVRRQVQVYSAWSGLDSHLAIHGIFYDESPHDYSDSSAAYLEQARQAVTNTTGIKDKTIVFNAGTIPDNGLYTSIDDIIIALEESYTTFESNQEQLSGVAIDRKHTGIIVHSVPTSASIQDLVNDMSDHANYIFATDLTVGADGNPYEAFGSIWISFIASMPQ